MNVQISNWKKSKQKNILPGRHICSINTDLPQDKNKNVICSCICKKWHILVLSSAYIFKRFTYFCHFTVTCTQTFADSFGVKTSEMYLSGVWSCSYKVLCRWLQEEQDFSAVLCLAYLHPFWNESLCGFCTLWMGKYHHFFSKLWKKTYSVFKTQKSLHVRYGFLL